MTTKRKGKTIPCEGCRERKKKCSAGQPCERCQRLGIKCYYLKSVTPLKADNSDAANNQEIRLDVEFLEDIINCMERDLYTLKNDRQSDDSNSKITQQKSAKSRSNWQLEFRKDGCISINTDIISYASLFKHIEKFSTNIPTHLVFPLVKQPTLATLSVNGGYLLKRALSSVLRKGNLKAILRSIEKKQHQSANSSPTLLLTDNAPSIVSEKKDLVLQIIDCYFSCCYLNRIKYHKKTFYDLFIHRHSRKNRKADPSPVVYALAAAVLTMRCKHIISIVPYDQQMPLGEYYFNKAHEAVSLRFDEPTLETMIIYLEMAVFKANTMQPSEAKMYLELGLRVRHILAETRYARKPSYYSIVSQSSSTATSSSTLKKSNTHHADTETDPDSAEDQPPQRKVPRSRLYNNYLGEYENFYRLLAGFQDCTRYMQFVNKQRGVPLKHGKPTVEPTKLFQYIMKERYNPQPLPDEGKEIIRAILKEEHLNCIATNMKQYFPRVRHAGPGTVPLSLIMDTEEKLKHAYFHKVPLDFRLSPSIFEDGISDAEFKKRLAEDGRCDVYSVAIALRYYLSLISVHEPFLPVIPTSSSLNHLSLIHDEEEPTASKRKRDEEEDDSSVLSIHSLRAQEICYHSSIKVVRLLEYQCTVLELCTISLPTLLCAWDNLMRNACLGMSEADLEKSGVFEYLTLKDIQLAREYAVRCIEVLRRGHLYNGAERELWEHYEKIESQLLTALCKSASPTAKYWEPVSNW